MKYLLKKIESRRLDFQGNLETLHCILKEFQRKGVVGVVLLREEKAFSERKILQVAPNCADLKSLFF